MICLIMKLFLHKGFVQYQYSASFPCQILLQKNHKLAKAISDVSWSEFFRMLEYKAMSHGCRIVRVPTFYPSSQTCCNCGYQNRNIKNLGIRKWECPECGQHHDRDTNAAKNILVKAKEIIAKQA